MNNDLKILSVSDIFTNNNYVIPIYQRNYAWGETQIEQLIEDIDSSIKNKNNEYFLGNLIVNQTSPNVYEVIDGQQRLTTLFLLKNYLSMKLEKESLTFEARKRSNDTLDAIQYNHYELRSELKSAEIIEGFQIIERYFNKNITDKHEFINKLKQVYLIRVQVPKDIDLNHYFEIMNTRGEQLELHEIAKAKFLAVLDANHDKKTAALIWEKCTNMDSYIQMNFDPIVRNPLFTNDWTSLKTTIKSFDSIRERVPIDEYDVSTKPLIDILEDNQKHRLKDYNDDFENERFESTLSFPVFLLQVNAAIRNLGEEDSTLDDKHFLNNLAWAWQTEKNAKNFLFHMLKCRVLFDKYIIKREYARDYKEAGRWSLQRLEKYTDSKGNKPKYVGTFDDDNSTKNKQIRTLQSSLRITYTSPKTMHWISLVLTKLIEDETCDIIEILESYSQTKVQQANFKNANGFGFDRIVFTYLDYLIYRNGYSYEGKEIIQPMRDDWQFQFRNSIEHFQPQFPGEGETWELDDLNGFGNLALITVSGNSKFSNLPPTGKINSYPSIINQSLKLKIMNELVNLGNYNWTIDKAKEHEKEMFKILERG